MLYESAGALHKDNYDYIRVLEFDFWNHHINVWIGGMTKSLSTLLGTKMREVLYEINFYLRVSTRVKSVLLAINKEFSLCANYPKGHGDLFRDWIDTYHPGVLILHVKIALGS